MNNEIRSMFRDAGIIVAITLIAGLVLGGVYQLTKEPIAEQKRIKKQKACQEVFAEADSFAEVEGFAEVVLIRRRRPWYWHLPRFPIPLRISMR